MRDDPTNQYPQDYNPNRTNNSASSSPEEAASTKKVVDTAAKGAAEYFAPGVGGKVYDTAKKVPGVGEAIDGVTSTVADTANKVPGVGKVAKTLDDSGAVDAVNAGIDMIGGKPSPDKMASPKMGANKGASSVPKGTTPTSAVPTGEQVTPSFHKNSFFNQGMSSSLEDEAMEDTSDVPSEIPENETLSDNNIDIPEQTESESNKESSNKNGTSDLIGDAAKSFVKKHPMVLVGIGGGIFFILIIFLILTGGSNQEQQFGYYDTACNYNDTRVIASSCNDETTETMSLEDFVKRMTYLYTKDGDYSDDTIKALMIVLKTNALSYGTYNSSSKEVNVNICDLYPNSSLEMLNVTEEELTDYSSIYQEIAEYLFISSSYRTSISSLGINNIISFNNNTLAEFELKASEGKDYTSILEEVYSNETEDSSEEVIYRDTLYIGDSRTKGMLNASVINENNTVYGTGYGYNWFIGSGEFSTNNTNALNGGIDGINAKMKEGNFYNIVIWLGVNDLGNASLYYEKYHELATGDWRNHNIYIISVGPVDDSKSMYAKNETINNFNSEMAGLINGSGLSNLVFVDLNINTDEIEKTDGVHYTSDSYKKIYNIISLNVKNELSKDLKLYRLTDYCTYYNVVTENDAYWWPIGSATATNGNIYGGNPVSVNVTSPYGMRKHPKTGEYKMHTGIDVGGVNTNTPVIATKNGTVVFAKTGCTESTCSCSVGGYGNNVKIDHGDGVVSLYAHLSSVAVKEGDVVRQGQKIGMVGTTGCSTGNHLHFEIQLNGAHTNPLDYVNVKNPRPVDQYSLSIDGTGATASENKALICQALLDSGFSEDATAGMLVNIDHEGGFQTTNLENCYEENACCTVNNKNYGFCVHTEIKGFGSDNAYTNGVDSGAYPKDKFVNDRAGYGLIQWTSAGRKQNLYEYAKNKNQSIGSLSVQLGYLLEELQQPNYKITWKYVTGQYSASEVAKNFCLDFESPSNEQVECQNRANEVSSYVDFVNNGCS